MEELDRLRGRSGDNGSPNGFLVEVHVIAHGRAEDVLSKCREALEIALKASPEAWPTIEHWRSLLPYWFVSKCAEEITREEAERRRKLPMEERQRLAEHWSVGAWVHWMKPAERTWYWWDAKVVSADELLIRIEVQGSPFPIGSLKWLLLVAGAEKLTIDD